MSDLRAETVRADDSAGADVHPRRGAGSATRRWITVAVGLAALAAFLALFISEESSYYLYILNSVLLAVIGASALNLLQGTAGQVSIGNAAFMAVGAFMSATAVRSGIGYPWDLIVAVASGAVAGLIVGLPAIKVRGFYLAFATLAANFIVTQLAETYQSHEVGSAGFALPIQFAGTSLTGQQRRWAILLAIVTALVLLLIWRLTSGKLGRAWRMIRDHEVVAPALGIRVARYKLVAFVISSSLIALQGGLAAHLAGYVTSDTFDLTLAISYVAMVLIGGPDSLLGSVIGAVVVICLPYLTGGLMGDIGVSGQHSAQIAEIVYGALLVAFVVYARGGLAAWVHQVSRAAARTIRRRIGPSSDPVGPVAEP